MKHIDIWQIQHAKARLSELVRATRDGPQIITVHGRKAAVLLSHELFESMARRIVECLREKEKPEAGQTGQAAPGAEAEAST